MRLKFGGIIVGAVGKVGGQCIQRFQNQFVLRNINMPTQRLASTNNPQRSVISLLSAFYNNLTEQQVADYASLGSRLHKSDPFGELSPMTSREAFFSINNFWGRYTQSFILANDVSLVIGSFTIASISLNSSPPTITIISTSVPPVEYMELRGEVTTNLNSYTSAKKATTFYIGPIAFKQSEIVAGFMKIFGTVTTGTLMIIYYRCYNSSGYGSAWKSIRLVWV